MNNLLTYLTDEEAVPVYDIIETSNHFVAFDYLLDTCLSAQDTYKENINYFYWGK